MPCLGLPFLYSTLQHWDHALPYRHSPQGVSRMACSRAEWTDASTGGPGTAWPTLWRDPSSFLFFRCLQVQETANASYRTYDTWCSGPNSAALTLKPANLVRSSTMVNVVFVVVRPLKLLLTQNIRMYASDCIRGSCVNR